MILLSYLATNCTLSCKLWSIKNLCINSILQRKMSSMAVTVPKIKLNNGQEIPAIGLGTWKSDPGVVTQTVKDALEIGYRHLDCALVYDNEKEIGVGIKAKIDDGTVKREDLFLTSKLWSTFHRPDLVAPSLRTSLADLNTTYLDMYLIHWPMAFLENDVLFPKDADGKWIFSDVDYVDTWKAMEECVSLGLVKSIGLSNFNSEQISRILDICTIKPVVNQVECNPYLNQRKLLEFCKSREIEVTAYSPLGAGSRPWVKATDPKLLDESIIIEIAKKYGKSPAQVALRWQIQRGIIVIPKTVSKNRLTENINVFDFTLNEDDVSKIDSLNCNFRALLVEWYKDHKYYPFNIEF